MERFFKMLEGLKVKFHFISANFSKQMFSSGGFVFEIQSNFDPSTFLSKSQKNYLNEP